MEETGGRGERSCRQRPNTERLRLQVSAVRRGGAERARRTAGGVELRTSLHDGSVDDGLDVVLPVARVDHTLPLRVLFDVALLEELEAHV